MVRQEATGGDSTGVLVFGEHRGRVTFGIQVTPRAKRDMLGLRDGQLRATLRAAPVDGAANAALIALLADSIGMPRSAVSIELGASSRRKRVAISSVTSDDLRRRFAAALVVTKH